MDNSNEIPDVAVVGAGLAGLAAAACVARTGHSVVVYERNAQPGGHARSTTRDDFIFNEGPHALVRGGEAERILLDLGVTLNGGQPKTGGVVRFEGRNEILPAGPLSMLRTKALGWREKVAFGRLMAGLARLDPDALASVCVAEWVDGVLPTERSRDLLHALIRLATYVNNPEMFSAQVALRQLQLAVGGGVLYLDGGWQSLVNQLRVFPDVAIETGVPLKSLPDARAVIVAVGNPAITGDLVEREFDVGPPAAASCLDLGLDRAPRVDLALGGDTPFYLSNHSAAATLARPGTFHVAAVQYMRPHDDPDPEAISRFAQSVGVDEQSITTSRRLHCMTTVSAIATAQRGGLGGRPSVHDTGFDNVFIAGDWVGPVGHLGDAVLASAEAAAAGAVSAVESAVSCG